MLVFLLLLLRLLLVLFPRRVPATARQKTFPGTRGDPVLVSLLLPAFASPRDPPRPPE